MEERPMKDTHITSSEWAKHKRPSEKRKIHKRERLAAKNRIHKETQNNP
jgi:hypothetical protein